MEFKGIRINEERKNYYERTGLWGSWTLLDYWNDAVCKHKDREFVVDDLGRRCTYADLDEKADVLAGWMAQQGVTAGDTVSIQCTPRMEFVCIVIACFKIGAVIVPMKMRTGAAEWVRLMNMCESRIHFCMEHYHGESMGDFVRTNEKELDYRMINIYIDGADLPDEACTFDKIMAGSWNKPEAPACSSNDVAVILFTSGTTKGSRGVLLTHNNIISSEQMFNRALELNEEDIIFMPAPLSHATGFHHGIISPILNGGKLVLQENYKANDALAIMEREKCTYSMGATPFIYDYLTQMNAGTPRPESLKYYICGGAPVPYELTRCAWQSHGVMVCECYGSTESVPHILVPPTKAMEWKGCWSGIALDAVEVRVVDENMQDVAPGETGEEISRGPNVFVGYLGDEESTAEVLDEDGWYHSGDLCRSDGHGLYKICGRKKDIIVRGGENLNINEMEANLAGFPGVRQLAIVGMPDYRLGERVCAFVALENDAEPVTKEQMAEYLAERKVSKWLWPERVEYIDEIPYTESGKIKRYELKKELKERLKSAKEKRRVWRKM